jgi:polyisoprenoid-binding protein YceI
MPHRDPPVSTRHVLRLSRAALITVALVLTALPGMAKPVRYVLEAERSSVTYETDFGPDLITGTMPVSAADLLLDFESVANSSVSVDLEAGKTTASFPFAAQALRGPKVLDTGEHPTIRFVSQSVKPTKGGATMAGNLTIRGVTRPVVLQAAILRQQGTEPGDLTRLTLRLTGGLSRKAFGATGWSDMVGDEVRLSITARIHRQD